MDDAKKNGTADEKTRRMIATEQDGGLSTEESDARYESGENPGGTHGGPGSPAKDDQTTGRDMTALQRPQNEEPQERREREPREEPAIPVRRAG